MFEHIPLIPWQEAIRLHLIEMNDLEASGEGPIVIARERLSNGQVHFIHVRGGLSFRAIMPCKAAFQNAEIEVFDHNRAREFMAHQFGECRED